MVNRNICVTNRKILGKIIKKKISEPGNIAEPVASTQNTQRTSNKNSSILSSPALSQISKHGMNFTPELAAKKKTSTPFVEKLKSYQFQSQSQDVESSNGALQEIQNIGTKRKRRLEDLFGDIYDIVEEDNYLKRHKTEEEKDFDTIDMIIEARKMFQTQINPLMKTNFDRLEALHKFKKDNLSRVIPR